MLKALPNSPLPLTCGSCLSEFVVLATPGIAVVSLLRHSPPHASEAG